jgi:hypothetical protein
MTAQKPERLANSGVGGMLPRPLARRVERAREARARIGKGVERPADLGRENKVATPPTP